MQRETRPNHRFRQAREARNQTQLRVAHGVSELLRHEVDPEYIGRLERGVITWPNAQYRAAFRRYFQVASDTDLGFYCTRSSPVPPWKDEDDEMRRRALLSALPLIGMGVSEPLATLVAQATQQAPIPRRVGAGQVAQIRTAATYGYSMMEQFGAPAVYEMLSAQLRWAVRLFDAHVDRWASQDLYSAVGSLSRHAVFAAHDLGLEGAANRYGQIALRCADEADDWALRAKAFHDLSRVAERSGEGDTALTLAQQAMVRPDRLTSLERATVTAAEAAAHGGRGDLNACLTALGRTEDYVAAADPANESPSMVEYFSSAELGFVAGYALWPLALRGRAVDESLQWLRLAADNYAPDRVRARLQCQTKLATLLFRYGDPDEAVSVASACLDKAQTVQSRWLTDDLRALRNATRQHRDRPGVAELRHTLNRTLGQSSTLP